MSVSHDDALKSDASLPLSCRTIAGVPDPSGAPSALRSPDPFPELDSFSSLTMFAQAEAIAGLIRRRGRTQEEIAARLSVSQSAVANKLRLLRYSPEEREEILSAPLTERHARALLRLTGPQRTEALRLVIDRHWNVARTEAYIDALLTGGEPPDTGQADAAVIAPSAPTDLTAFLTSLDRAIDRMRQLGITASCDRTAADGFMTLTIRLECFT